MVPEGGGKVKFLYNSRNICHTDEGFQYLSPLVMLFQMMYLVV